MTIYALGLLLMLVFMLLLVVAAVLIFAMESLELEDTMRDITTQHLTPVDAQRL